jgi:hypothetical protein
MRILYTLLEHTGPTLLLSSPRESSHFKSLSKTSFSRSCYIEKVKSAWRHTVKLLHYTRVTLTVLLGSIYTFRRDLMVRYFFQIAWANLGWTLGIASRDMNLSQVRGISISIGYTCYTDSKVGSLKLTS